ncbi:glycosyltransferase [Tunicatimonas pelagia]|uniref:glycosyltransferase n=1 Tax=Tunicatimonas pelagia TaxID=931531 RepID=UPI0026656C0D|nr:glycosyltransferase [Tunicatimonas pelagia]WKN42331.1 glycosyltransferase [Tunicatimonas pelagia]
MHNLDSIDIIMLALPRWDTPYSSTSYSLAKELAKSNRVFYIDNPFTVKDFITLHSTQYIQSRKKALLTGRDNYTKVKGAPPNFTVVTSPMTLPINALPIGKLYSLLSKRNDKIVYCTIKKLIQDFNIREYIFINSFNPLYGKYFLKKLTPVLSIYQAVDDISESRYMQKHGPRLETNALRSTDITLTTSIELTRLKSKYANNVFYLPNAADISLFKQVSNPNLAEPSEILGEKRRIICYIGNLDGRVNYQLLKDIALHHQQKLILLIGPLNSNEFNKYQLDQISNIKFIGAKNISLLPSYLQKVHCTIIPFKLTTLTKSIYPLKLNEYLAAGKPVITTNFSEEVEKFEPVVYVAQNNREFTSLINRAIAEDSPAKEQERYNWVAANSWEARAKEFWKITESFLIAKTNGT